MAATDDDGLAQDISSEDEDYADDEDGSDNDADVQGAGRRGAYSRKKSRGRDLKPVMTCYHWTFALVKLRSLKYTQIKLEKYILFIELVISSAVTNLCGSFGMGHDTSLVQNCNTAVLVFQTSYFVDFFSF